MWLNQSNISISISSILCGFMFKYQIVIHPLGMMYGSGGGFLSPENLIARSSSKFPPDAGTVAGLFLSANYHNSEEKQKLTKDLFVAGPFWREREESHYIWVPIPWNLVIGEEEWDQWRLREEEGDSIVWERGNLELDPDYSWQPISFWNNPQGLFEARKDFLKEGWKFSSILHPKMEDKQRSVQQKDGLFLENAVQLHPDLCLVYLSTHELEEGWYRFGGENHLVEIECMELEGEFCDWLEKPIKRAFALITPGVWGTSRFSHRSPATNGSKDFPETVRMLTDKPVPYRYSTGGRLGRGRYAVPSGSVYVLDRPLNKTWWDFEPELFPSKGLFKKFGCGLCLPVDIPGLEDN